MYINNEFNEFIKYRNFDYYCNQHTPIFHWTHINNLDSILKSKYLFSHNKMKEENKQYLDISNIEVQSIRASKIIFLGKTIHDCIPFYFSPNNAMFYNIKQNNQNNFDNLICFITTKQKIDKLGINYCFTDSNASKNTSIIFNKNSNISEAICEKLFFDSPRITGGYSRYYLDKSEYPRRSEKRQAEFLIVSDYFKISYIDFFVAKNENNCKIITNALKKYDCYRNNVFCVKDW